MKLFIIIILAIVYIIIGTALGTYALFKAIKEADDPSKYYSDANAEIGSFLGILVVVFGWPVLLVIGMFKELEESE